MAVTFQHRTPLYFARRYCKLPRLLFAAFLFFFWNYLPEPPKTARNARMDRPTPEYNIADKPRFLHHSRFREHPDYEYEAMIDDSLRKIEEKLITSTSAASFIRGVFSDVPDLARTYNSYPYDILRADLLRYLVLWYYGGYYADLDVYPARSIKSCPALNPLFRSTTSPESQISPNVSLVLGIEIDEPYASVQLMEAWHWTRIYGFIQYNMYAPRRFSPFLRRALVRALAHTRQRSQDLTLLSRWKYDESSILDITGPGMFTDAVLDVLSEALPATHPLIRRSVEEDRGTGELRLSSGGFASRVTWAPFHRLKDPLWVDASSSDSDKDMGGLGAVPIRVWGSGQRHSEAGYFGDFQACVNHRFGRTWKKGWWEYFFG